MFQRQGQRFLLSAAVVGLVAAGAAEAQDVLKQLGLTEAKARQLFMAAATWSVPEQASQIVVSARNAYQALPREARGPVTTGMYARVKALAPRVSYAQSIQDLPPDDPASDPTVDEPAPTVTVTSGGDQAPAAVYDGYGDIDWNGPDVFVRSPLDFASTSTTIAMERFEMATDGLAGSFPARPVTYDQALARIRGLFAAPKAKEALAKLRAAATADPKATTTRHHTALYAAIKGDLSLVLAALLVDHELEVNDPDALFNLAGAVSQAGLPNEALAFLDRLEASKRLPRGAFGDDPRACLDYARDYRLMLLGKLNESEAALEKALAREKFFADAHYTLAIVKKARGGDPKKHLMMGVWRTQPAAPRFCAAMFRGDPLEDDEPVAVEADDLFDLSKGIDGVLPLLSHPSSGEQLLRMMNNFNDSSPKLCAEVTKSTRLASDIYEVEPTKGLAVGANCDEAKVSVEGDVAGSGDAGLGVGVVGEVGVKRNGELAISAGPKGAVNVGAAEASTESKGYITVDSRGIQSVGVKMEVKLGVSAGGAKVSQAVDEVDFNVWQAPPHPAVDPQSGLRIDYGVE